ncbi:DUF1983 domain-containing protein [Burkholderia sp. USMB20]|nr:DUF1983 domain-containing protein [Burkholderia sp. USMB20]
MRDLAATSLTEIVGAGGGGGGGGGGVEAPDTLHSIATAKILDIVSEGPIVGPVDGLKSVVLGGTPIQNPDGSTNFQNFSVDWRLGTSDQTFLPGFQSVENEIAVGVALTSDVPWSKAVQNTQLTAVRVRFGVPAIETQDKSNGNINGYKIDYAIDIATDGGSFTQVLTNSFTGKAASLYERTERINLPASKAGWVVRVRRLTPNKHDSSIQDTVNIEALTEVIDRKLRYPNTALFGMQFDAKSFSSIPTRGYLVRGRIIAIPSNYDPETRTYFGTWDGTFKQGWTNNPAWIFRDLALHPRYGCGRSIDASVLDKWSLYEIAQYCDVMVPDGLGGMEPRFTCNAVIQSQADAFKVLQDVAGIFRGQAHWGAGAVVATADMPMEPARVYTQANVIDGKFNYSGTSRKSRYTVAQVSYNDKTNQFKQAVEYVQDDDGLARYGIIKASITAFGTTSQGQAHRLGLWAIHSSRLETQTVSFSVGLDGTMAAPGEVIAVADAKKAGRRIGGRIRGMSDLSTVVLDKAPVVKVGDDLTVIMPDGFAQKRAVSNINGDTIKVNPAFTDMGVSGAVWMVESDDLVSQLFRVISIAEESDNGQVVYTMNCAQHEPGKYALIDNGAQIKKRPITVIPPSVQPPPANVRITQNVVIDQGTAKTTMTVAWDAADKATSYLAKWRKDNGEWVSMPVTGALSLDVVGVYAGMYEAQVRAVNAMGVTSIPGMSQPTAIKGKTGAPPAVSLLTASQNQLFAIEINWGFPGNGSANDTQRTDIWQSRTPAFSDGVLQGSYAYPTSKAVLMGLAAGQAIYFWARLVDTSGNIGPWYPVETGAGVKGMSSADASPVLDLLAGQITDSQLGKDLLSKVDAIPALTDEVAALNSDVADLNTSIAQIPQIKSDVSGLQKNVSGLSTSVSSLSTAVTAIPGIQTDVKGLSTAVSSLSTSTAGIPGMSKQIQDNANAIAQLSTVDLPALNTSVADLDAHVSELHDQVFPWMAGDDGALAGNDGALAGIVTEQSMREEADFALGQRIEGVGAALNSQGDEIRASVMQEMQARADGDMAQAELTTALRADFNDNAAAVSQQLQAQADATRAVASDVSALKTSVGDNAAAISNLSTASSDADAALARQITNLSTSAAADIAAAVSTEQKARVDGDAANAQAISTLSTSFSSNAAAVQSQIQANADANKATASDVSALNTSVKDNAASISALSTASSEGDKALAASIAALSTSTADGLGAAIKTEQQARVDGDSANATAISSLQSTVKDTNAAIATLSTASADADKALAQSIANLSTSTSKDIAAAVSTETSARIDGDKANADAITALNTTVKDNTAGISALSTASADADKALAQSISDLKTQTGKDITAAVATEATARTSGDAANAKSITDLTTKFNDNAASVQTQIQAGADANAANASAISKLGATVDGNTSAINSLQKTTSDADAAMAQQIAGLTAQVNPAMAGDDGPMSGNDSALAGVYTEADARAEADMALAQKIESVQATLSAQGDTLNAAVQSETQARTDADGALAQSITSLTASFNDNAASVAQQLQAQSDATSAVASSVTSLTTDVKGNKAAISDLAAATSDADSALGQRITDLSVSTAADTKAQIATEQKARVDGDSANADAITSLRADYNANSALVQEQINVVSDSTSANALSITNLQSSVKDANAAISTESKARSDGDTANATAITNLATKTTADIGAAITTEAKARSDADTALTQSITNLSSTVDKNAATVTTLQKTVTDGDAANAQAITDLRAQTATDISSAVNTEATARVSGDKVNADAITTLQSSVKDTSATVQTQGKTLAALDGQLSASYTIKAQVVNGQTYAASMALGADGSGNTSILFSASTFAVIDPSSGKVSSPFAIQNGQVFIANGFISNGYITNAMLGDATVTTAKIANGSIDQARIQNGAIGSAQIQDGAINTAKIGDAQISTAKIGVAQIDTLRIAGGAVTTGQYFEGNRTMSGNFWCTGGPVMFVYGGYNSSTFTLLIDGGVVAVHQNTNNPEYSIYSTTLGAGTHSFQLSIANPLGGTVRLTVYEFKR